MRTNIIIGLLTAVVILLAAGVALLTWPQYQEYQEKKAFQAQWAKQKAQERVEHNEFMQTICTNLENASWERKNKCKEWKNGK